MDGIRAADRTRSACSPCRDLIDAHVHLREPGQAGRGIANGTLGSAEGRRDDGPRHAQRAADHHGGNGSRAIRELFARKSRVNYGLFQAAAGGLRAPEHAVRAEDLHGQGVGSRRRATSRSRTCFARAGPVVLHVEDERKFSTVWKKFSTVWKNRAKLSMVWKIVFLQCGKLVHHSGAAAALRGGATASRPRGENAGETASAAADRALQHGRGGRVGGADEVPGHDVWAETCPHYFLFTEQGLSGAGSRLQVNPPLRSEEDRRRSSKP